MNEVGAYKDVAVTTQSKGRLIVLLYEGAIKFMKLAIKELETGNYKEKGQYINRAQDIINNLLGFTRWYSCAHHICYV